MFEIEWILKIIIVPSLQPELINSDKASNASYVIIKAHLGHNLISSHYMIGYRFASSGWCSIMCNYSRSGRQDGETGICKPFHGI